ncbi:MAG TPA: glycosyl hydrolase 108 family protein [Paludibacter sp.]|nr:glycosyl hydrolase 108 family protein [Paludibacter sp.]
MANFKPAITKVLLTEGGYANDPNDNGGETYRGVARKFWPNWSGWTIVDTAKNQPNFPKSLSGNAALKDSTIEFYKINFWDKIGGDKINNQSIADLLVDSAVNEGTVPAIKRAQGIVDIAQTGHVTNELVEKLNLMA